MSNLSISASMDVGAANAAAISLRNSLREVTAEANALDRAIKEAGGGATEEMRASFVAVSAQIAGMQQRLNAATSEVRAFTRTTSEGLGGMHGSLSTATREFRALFDELSSGRTRMTPGTLAIIATRVFGLGPAALAGGAAVLGLAGALGYLAVRGVEAANALDQIFAGARFAGNLDITRDQIKSLVNELAALPGVSQSDAEKTVGAFARLKDGTTPEIRALTAEIRDYAQATGKDLDQATETLVKAFENPTQDATRFVSSLGGVTQAQLDAAKEAERSGDANKAAAAMLDALDAALGRVKPALDEHNAGILSSARNALGFAMAAQGGIRADTIQNMLLDDQNRLRERQIELFGKAMAQLRSLPPTPEQTLRGGITAAVSADKNSDEIAKAVAEIGEMNRALDVARTRGDQLSVDRLTKGLAAAQQQLDELKFGPVLEQARAEIAKLQESWTGSQSGLDAAEAAVWQRYLAQVRAGSTQALSLTTEAAHAETAARRAAGEEAITAARDQAAKLNGDVAKSEVERLASVRQVWSQLVAGEILTAKQHADAQKELDTVTAQLNKARLAQTQEINREDLAADVEIAKYRLQAEKQNLEEELAAHRITVAQKTALLKA
jgi:hypothetical protein